MLRIRDARESKGWSQERLAVELNTTQQTIQRWETGQTDVKSTQIKAISKALGVTVSYLLDVETTAADKDTISPISADEEELINCYRQVEPWERDLILSHARMVMLHVRGKK